MAERRKYRGGAARTALVGLLTGLSLICLYLAFVAPSGKLGVVALAGIFPAGAVVSAGLAAGFFCYAATGILGMFLIPSKSVALLYLIFFGLWPMLKSLLLTDNIGARLADLVEEKLGSRHRLRIARKEQTEAFAAASALDDILQKATAQEVEIQLKD